MGLMKELSDLGNIYSNMYDEAYTVTNADKKGNTPAYKAYKAGKKGKDGKPMYKAADHLKDEVEILKGLLESGKLSEDEVKDILWNQIDEDAQSDALAQMMGDGGDPQEDAIKQIVKAEKKAAKKKKVKSEGYQRNPEKGEEEERKRSKKVPGERTPMPPRGDKRREDFERWYAANVR